MIAIYYTSAWASFIIYDMTDGISPFFTVIGYLSLRFGSSSYYHIWCLDTAITETTDVQYLSSLVRKT